MYFCLQCNSKLQRKSKFCCLKCHKEHTYINFIARWLRGEENWKQSHGVPRAIHRYLRETFGEKCSQCGWDKIHPITNKVPVEVDHINGKWDDNRLENLRLLCPNCHSLTPTYRGLNRGKGDPNRYKSHPKIKKEKLTYSCFICDARLACDNILELKTGLCQPCEKNSRRTYEISKEELEKLISSMPMTKVAAQLGVSDNAVRKRCKTLGISLELSFTKLKIR